MLDDEARAALAAHTRVTATRTLLTAREQEIIELVAEGRTQQEIADRLYLSPANVMSHLANIFDKLGVSERAAAVTEAMRRGVLK